ncbi:hypothetical protein HDU67_008618 [Dinochytrium kinnereticum]|nr:hypothetical protein HDU67_008618 [Dinochytrium kinnereticum]
MHHTHTVIRLIALAAFPSIGSGSLATLKLLPSSFNSPPQDASGLRQAALEATGSLPLCLRECLAWFSPSLGAVAKGTDAAVNDFCALPAEDHKIVELCSFSKCGAEDLITSKTARLTILSYCKATPENLWLSSSEGSLFNVANLYYGSAQSDAFQREMDGAPMCAQTCLQALPGFANPVTDQFVSAVCSASEDSRRKFSACVSQSCSERFSEDRALGFLSSLCATPPPPPPPPPSVTSTEAPPPPPPQTASSPSPRAPPSSTTQAPPPEPISEPPQGASLSRQPPLATSNPPSALSSPSLSPSLPNVPDPSSALSPSPSRTPRTSINTTGRPLSAASPRLSSAPTSRTSQTTILVTTSTSWSLAPTIGAPPRPDVSGIGPEATLPGLRTVSIQNPVTSGVVGITVGCCFGAAVFAVFLGIVA